MCYRPQCILNVALCAIAMSIIVFIPIYYVLMTGKEPGIPAEDADDMKLPYERQNIKVVNENGRIMVYMYRKIGKQQLGYTAAAAK